MSLTLIHNRNERKYFDSADYSLDGIALAPHPNLLQRKTKPTLSKIKYIKNDRKFFDSAEWVLTGEVNTPHPNYCNSTQ